MTHLVKVRVEDRPFVVGGYRQREYRATCLDPNCGWTEKAITDREARNRGFLHEFHLNNKVKA